MAGTVHGRDLGDGAVGGWLQLPGSVSAELMGSVGFDFLCIDQQHGLIGDDALVPMLQALEATGTPAFVRVAVNEHAVIGRALDRGAAAVVVPLVETAEQARAAVAACRYPPAGDRSYGQTRTTFRERPEPRCIVMIETLAGVDALPQILAVDGVDAIFVGPTDLALSAGLPVTAQHADSPHRQEYEALLARVIGPTRERGLPVGIYAGSAEHARRFRALGMTWTALFSEIAMLRGAAVGHLREARA
jgi:4-hydroxy-2-oxoheptanedioate aldolase